MIVVVPSDGTTTAASMLTCHNRAMPERTDRFGASSSRPPREAELLAVTLRLLQEHGYDRLTMDAVASNGRASKATVYRLWPSKAELVLAAFIEGVRQVAVPPDTGALRGDLLCVGEMIRSKVREHAGTLRAVLAEVPRHPAFNDALQHQFVNQLKVMILHVVHQAIDRGEISSANVTDELWDLLPGYLIFRSITAGQPPTRRTVQTLVDEVIIPGLTRSSGQHERSRVSHC